MSFAESVHVQFEEEVFSPDDYLINIIKRAVKNNQNIHISIPSVGNLIIRSSSGEYIDNTEDLKGFCQYPASEYKVNIISDKDVETDRNRIGRNIDELMWFASFHISNGRLMEGCYRDDVVELMHWPNLTRIPGTPNTMRLASLLSQYPTSITLACRLLRIDKAEAYQFYSAARCAGLARAVNRVPEEPPLKPHRNQALLSLLLNKIARI